MEDEFSDFYNDRDEEFEIVFGGGEEEDEPFFADATGMFAIMSAAGQLLKSKLRSLFFFAAALVFVLAMILILATELREQWPAFFVGPLFAAGASSAAVGVIYFYRSTQWSKVLLAANSTDPAVAFTAFRVLGDTFASEDGEKFVPPLSGGRKLFLSRAEKEIEKKQKTLDAVGMAIDAYTAAAFQAKLADDNESSKEVLYVVLDMVDDLQKPSLSSVFPVDQMEHLEVAICLYLIALAEQKRRQDEEVTTSDSTVTLYDFEKMDNKTESAHQGKSTAELFRRAAKVLARQNEMDFAITCYKKSSWWFKQENNLPEFVSSCIDAGFIASIENDMAEAEELLDSSRSHLLHCPPETARRWWVLDAIIADAYDDEERCRLATANAEFLNETSVRADEGRTG